VKRTSAVIRSPTAGMTQPFGSQTIDTCWCGGSANQRCLPAQWNGESALDAAGDDHQGAVLGAAALAVSDMRTRRKRMHRKDRARRMQGAAIAEPEPGADARA
jgi:hypothetical protein